MSKKKNSKNALVIGIYPEQYKITDIRLNKPVCYQSIENGSVKGSMVLQDINEIQIKGKKLEYFSPNNIGVLLSINSKYTAKAEITFNNEIINMISTEKVSLDTSSTIVCNYLEQIQTALVFGYTALETFANLSIPDNYEYKKINKSKGIHEIYVKEAIERWLSLKEKIQYILPNIYKADKVDTKKWWGRFSNLEKLRNNIIHQKSVHSTEFYKCYFKESIFDICKCPKEVLKFFYNAHEKNNQTNPIWPWLDGEKNVFPINQDYKPDNFELIGNIHEGLKKI
jgi:hypothetical protein